MIRKLFSASVATMAALVFSASADETTKFQQDRAAILGMAGKFKITFDFEETVALLPDYELRKPYHSEAKELVKVVEDKGEEITLQHLLVIDDMDGPMVIKHWAQIWKYEDPHVLEYEGDMTWLPVTLSDEQVEGTWTQYVTQVDDSPRYKAAGKWVHEGNYSAWTSMPSTRPLPRREYTKRSDYDLLKVVNTHIITPDGWVHQQENRKFVRRNGANQSICLEKGLNNYTRITEPSEIDNEDFAAAEDYWSETYPFWADVREAWNTVLTKNKGPVHYDSKVNPDDKENLMSRMSSLAETFKEEPKKANRKAIDSLLAEHLR
ncbi:MAG: hypothetical protein Q7Q71_16280 [Verrucomicrobiota bacterium JB023]|nr:hypothetical protein [Verrucomicrobiota bacterium JB023]